MKKYLEPSYEKELIETVDIMSVSDIIQDGDTTNASGSLDDLLGDLSNSLRD